MLRRLLDCFSLVWQAAVSMEDLQQSTDWADESDINTKKETNAKNVCQHKYEPSL